jgi:translation elongation factor EF-G
MSDKGFVTVVCEVALSNMFGYSTDLRSSTQVRLRSSLVHLLCSPCVVFV